MSTSDARHANQTRTYERASSVVFLKTDAPFGGLSNMAAGFPLRVNGIRIRTSEALYQACRFPHRPEVQALIIEQASPMTAKMKGKPYRHDSRPDWDHVRVKIMRWCLRVKLAQNWPAFSALLLETGERSIVEESRKDPFWGAMATADGTLVGMNVLGRLLMELREAVKMEDRESFMRVKPLGIPDFLLAGRPIEIVASPIHEGNFDPGKAAMTRDRGDADGRAHRQPSLFDGPVVKEVPPVAYLAIYAKSVHVADLKPYADYKESDAPWFGDVPEHWEVKRLGAVFAERSETNEKYEVAEVLSVLKDIGVIPYSEKGRIGNKKSDDVGRYKIVRPEDLVLNSMNVIIGSVGASRYTGCLSPVYYVLKRRDGANNPRFLELVFQHKGFQQSLVRIGSGILAHRMRIPMEKLKAEVFPLPPPDEQAAIVLFMDWANGRLERAIRAKRKVIALLNEQKRAIIHRAVTCGLDPDVPLKPSGIPWLGDIPQHWEVWRISRFAKVGNGSTPSRAQPRYWNGGSYPWLNSSQINRGTIDSADQFVTRAALKECHLPRVPAGSVLVAITGQGKTRGMSAVLSVEATINQHVAYIAPRVPVVRPEFLHLSLTAAYAQLRAISDDSGSTKGALTCEDIKRFKVPIPPQDEQTALLNRIRIDTGTLDATLSRLDREIELLREYRTRLVSDVVTGKLDVREAAAHLPDESVPGAADEDDGEIEEELDSEAEDAAA